ncbi:hypothetical protein PRIPAC_83765 [Pristionchus pacificus]|uniref:Uncharacterized protein n=1 Tax=Pristionchus pacificus TaxID=54126 RepID=A0A2A6BT43_PRIPA|nr:hypothetical protein PRIPAC_83765 [Pristionchus pacificus]|eukprot:PDM69074.1 hypothetical protein PRIPAC_47376 [Pristionchus pacificus]
MKRYIFLDQGINDTRNENAQQFAECAKEIIEILKGVVQPNVSSEVMIKRVMHGFMKEKAGTENDGGKEMKALVKLLKKFPLDQAKGFVEWNWTTTNEVSNGESKNIGREKRFHGIDPGTFMPIWAWTVQTSIGPLLREWLIPNSPLTKCMNYKDCFEHIHGKKRPQLRSGESSEQAVGRLSAYFVEQFRNRKTGMFARHEKTITDAIVASFYNSRKFIDEVNNFRTVSENALITCWTSNAIRSQKHARQSTRELMKLTMIDKSVKSFSIML